eukprot:357370-Chlamydomonas_euryale.AAC.2
MGPTLCTVMGPTLCTAMGPSCAPRWGPPCASRWGPSCAPRWGPSCASRWGPSRADPSLGAAYPAVGRWCVHNPAPLRAAHVCGRTLPHLRIHTWQHPHMGGVHNTPPLRAAHVCGRTISHMCPHTGGFHAPLPPAHVCASTVAGRHMGTAHTPAAHTQVSYLRLHVLGAVHDVRAARQRVHEVLLVSCQAAFKHSGRASERTSCVASGACGLTLTACQKATPCQERSGSLEGPGLPAANDTSFSAGGQDCNIGPAHGSRPSHPTTPVAAVAVSCCQWPSLLPIAAAAVEAS